ncbi:MAG: signal peptidase I [Clostridia bacterium]|nr:signal peptidase I [Clostridia bacterium]
MTDIENEKINTEDVAAEETVKEEESINPVFEIEETGTGAPEEVPEEASEMIELSETAEAADEAAPGTEGLIEGDISEDGLKPEEEPKNWFMKFMKAKKPSPLYWVREALSYVLIFLLAIVIGLFINIYIVRLTRVNGNSMYPTLKSNQLLAASRLPVIFNDIHRGDVVIFNHTGEKRTFKIDFSEALSDNAITALFKKSKSQEEHTYYIKRVIGVKGDVIRVYEGKLYRTTLKKLGLEEYLSVHTSYCKNPENSDLQIKQSILVKKIANITPDETWELLDKESEPYINQDEDISYYNWEGKCWIVGDREFFAMGDNRNHSRDCRDIGIRSIDCMVGKVLGKH